MNVPFELGKVAGKLEGLAGEVKKLKGRIESLENMAKPEEWTFKAQYLKTGWLKVVEGHLPIYSLRGPVKVVIKDKWGAKPHEVMRVEGNASMFLTSPIIIKAGQYYKEMRI